MKADPRRIQHSEAILVAVVALATAMGMQSIRVTIPYLIYLLVSRLGLHPIVAGIVLLAPFLAGAAYPRLVRAAGLRRTFAGSAVCLALARLGLQLWQGDPVVDFLFAALASASFFVLLPGAIAAVRTHAQEAGSPGASFAVALLLGFALDACLGGVFLTYDYAWQPGTVPILLATGLSAALLMGLAFVLRRWTDSGTPPSAGMSWGAVGCLLFLEAAVFGNTARVAVASESWFPEAFAVVMVGQALGVLVAVWLPSLWPRIWIAASVVLLAALVLVPTGLLPALGVMAGQAALAVLLVRIASGNERPSPSALPLARAGLWLLVFVGLVEAPRAIWLPYESWWVLPAAGAAAVLLAARAIADQSALPARPLSVQVGVVASAVALLALVAPLAIWLAWESPRSVAAAVPGPVRIVSYNIHKGFDTSGHLDLEALARVIEAERPDVIALQEVSRGQISESSVDMAVWLSWRLDLPIRYTPLGVEHWGQAILTQLPVHSLEERLLPPLDLPTVRSYTVATIDVGAAEPLHLVNTHYTASRGHADRLAHSKALAPVLRQRGPRRTVLAGDLNATPDSPPLQLLFDLGLVDAIEAAGISPGYTARSYDPTVRIDYLLYSPDLLARDVVVGESLASDHLIVAATFEEAAATRPAP